MPVVKDAKRSRADRASETRRRMLDSARDLFVNQGYGATTMGQVAADAGVAVQTLYYTFQTKGKLLCEVIDVVAAGDDPQPVTQRPWTQGMLSAKSAQRVLALAVEHGTGIYERAAPLWPAVNAAAATDPHVQHYWERVTANRQAGQARMVSRLSELGALRDGLAPQRATDLVVVLFGHDVFRGLREAGWAVTEYKRWLYATLVNQLLGRQRLDPRATRDLSYRSVDNAPRT